MFDKSKFDELKSELQANIKDVTDDAIKNIAKTFGKLPAHMKAAFDVEGAKGLLNNVGKLQDKLKQAEETIRRIDQNKKAFNKNIVDSWNDELAKMTANYKAKQKGLKSLAAQYAGSQNPFYQQLSASYTQQAKDEAKTHKNERARAKAAADKNAATGNSAFDMQSAIAIENKKNILALNRINLLKDVLTYVVYKFAEQIGKAGQNLLKAGFDGAQTVHGLGQVLVGEAQAAFQQGVITSPDEFSKAYGSVSNGLGVINGDTKDHAADAAKLSVLYGLSADAAGHLVSQLTRINGYSKTAAKNITDYAIALAVGNHLAANTVLEDMANNADALARYAGKSADEFDRASISAAKIGVGLKDIDAFSGRMVDDFGAALQSQAQLQTAIPGLDLNRFLIASQFSPGKAPEELRKAFQGKLGPGGFGSLPRSIQDMISKATGFGGEQLSNLFNPKGLSTNLEKADTTSPQTRNFETSMVTMVTGILGHLQQIVAGIGTFLVGWKILSGAGFSGLLASIGIGGGAAGASAGAAAAGGAAGGGILATVGRGAFKALPVIGSILDFGLRKMSGESTGKSASGAIGGLIGAGLGSVLGPLGTAAGGFAGDQIGAGGYDMLHDKKKYDAMKNHMTANAFSGGDGIMQLSAVAGAGLLHALEGVVFGKDQSAPEPSIGASSADQTVDAAETALATIANTNTASLKVLMQVLRAIESGHIIQMDAEKVGKVIVKSNSRG